MERVLQLLGGSCDGQTEPSTTVSTIGMSTPSPGTMQHSDGLSPLRYTGWAKKVRPQTHRHNSAKS